MANRHIPQVEYPQALLHRTGEQLSDTLAVGNTHLGAQQASRFCIGADVQRGRCARPIMATSYL
jgi:hypothetical protein